VSQQAINVLTIH
jgi:hypothetical protein